MISNLFIPKYKNVYFIDGILDCKADVSRFVTSWKITSTDTDKRSIQFPKREKREERNLAGLGKGDQFLNASGIPLSRQDRCSILTYTVFHYLSTYKCKHFPLCNPPPPGLHSTC